MIKTFRGKIGSGGLHTISLHTTSGSVGYRIIKLRIVQQSPGTIDNEGLIQVWKVNPGTGVAIRTINFSDPTLLGISLWTGDDSGEKGTYTFTSIFDQEIFNQDIYVTYYDVRTTNDPMNYYLELELMKLNENENTVATLKDIRASVVTQ